MTDDFNLDGEVVANGIVPSTCPHDNPHGACMQCNIDEVTSKTVV